MSDTPRTDAYTVSRSISLLENGVVHYIIELFVTREFARQLERELNAEREKVRALRDALTEIMENSSGWAESTAREALESAEGAK